MPSLVAAVDQALGDRDAIGWPTARYWHITFLFWNTTRRAPDSPGTCRARRQVDDLFCLDAAVRG